MYGPGRSSRFGGAAFVLGAPGRARRVSSERRRLEPRDALGHFSDGVRWRINLAGEHDLCEHPVVVAQSVVERFGRDDDDVLVVVVA